ARVVEVAVDGVPATVQPRGQRGVLLLADRVGRLPIAGRQQIERFDQSIVHSVPPRRRPAAVVTVKCQASPARVSRSISYSPPAEMASPSPSMISLKSSRSIRVPPSTRLRVAPPSP